MKRESLSIAIACAVGALIGTLVGIEIAKYLAPALHWWCAAAGMFAGSIVAYVTIDFRQFCAGVNHAYHNTIAWRPYGLYWKTVGMAYASVISLCLTLAIGVIVTFVPFDLIEEKFKFSYLGFFLAVVIACSTLLSFGATSCRRGTSDDSYEELLLRQHRIYYEMFQWINPIGVTYYALKGLWWMMRHLPWLIRQGVFGLWVAIVFLGYFISAAFVYVHSTRRTICFVDAGLGALIGFMCGSPIVGAISGAMLGVLNYELVSVRLLKLTVRR